MPLSKSSLERLIEASPDIVVATDPAGTVAFYNDGAQRNLGYAREEIIGQTVTLLYPSRDEAKRVMTAMRDPALDGRGRVINFPTTFVAKDGHEIPVAISGVILYDDAGGEEGTIGFAKDLTEIQRKDKLAVLGEIAIGLSHEINNPLETILNQLDLVERFVASHALPEEAPGERKHVRTMRSEVERIEHLLLRLNQMARHEEYRSAPYLGETRMIDLSARAPEASPLAGCRILVVDDDGAVRESIAEMLSAYGCEVTTAPDGYAALEALDRGELDVVLSDVVMPGMDGYELFRQVRSRAPGMPVVLMTAFYYDKDHVIKRSRMEGLEGVVFKKPVDPDRLRETLAEVTSSSRPAPS